MALEEKKRPEAERMTAEGAKELFIRNREACLECGWACTEKGCKAKDAFRTMTARQWGNIAKKFNEKGYVRICQEVAKKKMSWQMRKKRKSAQPSA